MGVKKTKYKTQKYKTSRGEKRSKIFLGVYKDFLGYKKTLTVKEKTDELDLKITYCLQKITKKIIKPKTVRKY